MPGSGWEPATAVLPNEPTKNDTYYDYTVYLDPTVYTVRKGHRLKLYIIGLGGGGNNSLDMYKFVKKYTKPVGFFYAKASKYEFTIDNSSSSAELPIEKK